MATPEEEITLRKLQELAASLGGWPTPADCPRLGGLYSQLQSDLGRINRYILPLPVLGRESVPTGKAAKQEFGPRLFEVWLNTAAWLTEADRVYAERLYALPFWRRWVKYLRASAPDLMRDWFRRIDWGF